MKSNRIVVVDDHPVVGAGISYLLQAEPDLELCGQASSAEEAMGVVAATKPDLVIVDLSLPGKSGLELIKDLKVMHPDTLVLVISMHDEKLYGERSLKAGAMGYLMKEATSENLVKAIRRILSGNVYVSNQLNRALVSNLTAGKNRNGSHREGTLSRLSDRELEVFELLGRGVAAETMAKDLCISIRTIDAHRTNIRKKLGLPDSVALLRYAVRWVETGNEGTPQ